MRHTVIVPSYNTLEHTKNTYESLLLYGGDVDIIIIDDASDDGTDEWLQSLENKANIDKLSNVGWYLPFKNNYAQSKYYPEKLDSDFFGPSKRCWDNSWSLPPLDIKQKIKLEKLWSESLTP